MKTCDETVVRYLPSPRSRRNRGRGPRSTAEALPAIIANLQGRGFRLVTVSKLLEAAPKAR